MYKSLQAKLKTFHQVCNKPSEFRIAFAPFYRKDFYTILNEIKKVVRSPYLVLLLANQNSGIIYESDGNLPDYFSFRICGKLKNEVGSASFYESRYLFFNTDSDNDRIEIYSVNNDRISLSPMEETKDRYLVASINSKEYKIEKIRTVLVAFLMEELEYLTKTFAIELNAELNYSSSYATEGNEIYQI